MFRRSLCGILLLNIGISANLFSQYSETQHVIPPSPAIAAYQKYGDYPVSYSTGLPDIKIPLYDIKIKDFVFPIDISFHASGRRPDYEFSTLGVGWLLNASGYISREIRDRPDELASPGMEKSIADIGNTNGFWDPLKAYNNLIPADITIPANASSTYLKDAEHDVYSYSVNGISGKFILDDGRDAVPLTSTSCYINSYARITDEKGVRYEFGGTNKTEFTEIRFNGQATNIEMARHLNKIILPSGEEITFTYGTRWTTISTDRIESPPVSTRVLTYGNLFRFDNTYPLVDPAIQKFEYEMGGYNVSNITTSRRDYPILYLKSIEFSYGKVFFTYDDTTLKLQSMEVFNLNNVRVKSVEFSYIRTPGTLSELPNNNSASLSTLILKGNISSDLDKYTFDYYNYQLPHSSDTQEFNKRTDWWGYVNSTGDRTPVESYESPALVQRGCVDCKSAGYFSKISGMLKKIVYPTGGNTEFIYEPNLYSLSGTTPGTEGPGLRIGKIISDGGTENKIVKTYKYGTNEDGLGKLIYMPNARDFRSYQSNICYFSADNRVIFSGAYSIISYALRPVDNAAEGYRQPIYYPFVTEYTESASGTNNGKVIYQYSIPETVTAFIGTAGSFRMKNWTGNKMLSKEVYKKGSTPNSYKLIQRDQNVYNTFNYRIIPQIRMHRIWGLDYENTSFNYRPLEMNHANIGYGTFEYYGFPFELINNPIESAVEKIESQTSTIYDDLGGYMDTKTSYFYDNLAHLQPTRTETIISNKEKIIEEIKYPMDFLSPGQTPIQQAITNLKNKHIFAPLEKSLYLSTLTGTQKRLVSSQFFAYNPTKPLLDSVMTIDVEEPISNFTPLNIESQVLTIDNRYKSRHYFDVYDAYSNLLQQHTAHKPVASYVWGYNQQYPMAEVVNALSKDIFYLSFEEGYGTYTNAKSKTGKWSRKDAFSTTLTGLTNGKYTLSYWKSSADGLWNYVMINDIDVNGSYAIAISNPGYYIDDIRFYPKDAQMTTYTYDQLVGMTSMTDPKGKITYYEYDNSMRLQHIRDQDRNIIKSYKYHYKQ
ncbi:hypothetical protein FBD94_14750 [Pedobacter hiemivivus]|uniref:RHS repeat protein n=1 Tax=Pedobacter hiemivivus TaxID=2530454 RepID=A0A4U1GBA6_9SPHI|nr:hypothetical protein [Pedobacter hiemivivus]TKC60170.1 hypothetical protein FBD94_14750 [Pedobacter hiemivivus]